MVKQASNVHGNEPMAWLMMMMMIDLRSKGLMSTYQGQQPR